MPAAAPTASSGSRASTGIDATSWNSDTDSTLRPATDPARLRSASTPRPMAVELIASAKAPTAASRQSSPNARPTAAITAVEPISCTLPQPKIGPRSAHSRFGSSSSPTRNSISTTPNSAN